MSTTTPPTTPQAQRLRLMRSTRKLCAVLGETPLVVDAKPGLKRSASLSTRPARYELVMGLPRLTLAHCPDATSGSACPTALISPPPLSPTFGLPSNSSTDSFPASGSDPARRRKMAKLMRTLGENVPPELVFGPSSPSFASSFFAGDDDIESLKGAKLRRRATLASPFSRASTPTRSSFDSDSIRSGASSTHAAPGPSGSDEFLVVPTPRNYTNKTHRKEQGWSGEWAGSVRNMEEVVKGLRGLKAR